MKSSSFLCVLKALTLCPPSEDAHVTSEVMASMVRTSKLVNRFENDQKRAFPIFPLVKL